MGAYFGNIKTLEALKRGRISSVIPSFRANSFKAPQNAFRGARYAAVYEAINALQETPWRINKRVLDVVLALRERGLEIAGLPEKYDPEIHGRPEDWKKESHSKYEEGMKHMMKNFECARTLGVAQTYRREERFYFVHTLDFRGRAYPVTSYLSPQGKDLDRGLLTFAEECGEPLGERGAISLARHGANCWGNNKLPFEERIAWVEEHTPRIVRIGEDPLSDYWWEEAEEPFQFLAFCFEWAGYQREGIGYRCSLPISVDGCNNALQHFSALLLDKELGEATNMLPTSKPRDVYQEVCDLVNARIEQDAAQGKEEALLLQGKITRKVVKTPVMTAYYGVKPQGMEEQIEEAFEEQGIKLGKGKMKAISYLVTLLREEIIPQKTPSVKPCMELLKEVTRILAKNNQPTIWTTPSGFLVVQEYKDYPRTKVRTKLFGKMYCIKTQQETVEAKINVREHTDGISANFIHSLDSAAMMLCTLEAKSKGVKAFRMIHDGFSTIPAHMDILNKAIRKSFREMYEKEDLLKKFVLEALDNPLLQTEPKKKRGRKKKVKTGEEVWVKFNIQKGTLKLHFLDEAEYFFA